MKQRPVTTLFMLSSVDGKISTGVSDVLDVDCDFPKLKGVREGLHQYYEIERTTDLWSLNSGRVQEKIGVNRKEFPDKTPVSFVVIDNKHLTKHGVRYFCSLSKAFVKESYNCDRITIQTGGTLNGLFLREKLFDYIDIVIPPVLIGGKETSSLVDGVSLSKPEELEQLGILKLEACDVLEDSYIRLKYKVIG